MSVLTPEDRGRSLAPSTRKRDEQRQMWTDKLEKASEVLEMTHTPGWRRLEAEALLAQQDAEEKLTKLAGPRDPLDIHGLRMRLDFLRWLRHFPVQATKDIDEARRNLAELEGTV